MARYRSKDSTDLRWNRMRRRATRELDTQVMDWREEALNVILTALWAKYVQSLQSGDTLELESHYETWVAQVLEDVIGITIEGEADEVA